MKTSLLLCLTLTAFAASAEKKTCVEDPDVGTCKGSFPMYYYDSDEGKCKEFIYGGCGGNGNRYVTQQECMENCGESTWTSLKVTWGINFSSPTSFVKLPRTEAEARKEQFTKLDGDCSGKFLGKRYIKGSDTSVVLLYDKNGYIAGIQSGLPKSDVDKVSTTFSFANSPAYQLDTIGEENIYFITAYFIDPSKICSSGRSSAEYDDQGTGTGLYLQNGPNPIANSIAIPLYEKDMANALWTKGGCFPTMGVHYWYNMKGDFDCRKLHPTTVIYDQGKITSFAFASIGYFDFSSRVEHPPKEFFGRFLPTPVPQCLFDEYDRSGGFTTMHVFFSDQPWTIVC